MVLSHQTRASNETSNQKIFAGSALLKLVSLTALKKTLDLIPLSETFTLAWIETELKDSFFVVCSV